MARTKRYDVEKALQLRYSKESRTKEYLIKWDNYPMAESTWEPVDTLKEDCPSLLKEYMHNLEQHKTHCLARRNENYKTQKGQWTYYTRFDLEGRPLAEREQQRLEKEQRKLKQKEKKAEDWDILSVESRSEGESVKEVKALLGTAKRSKKSVPPTTPEGEKLVEIVGAHRDPRTGSILFSVRCESGRLRGQVKESQKEFSNEELRNTSKDLLLDYYESKLRVIPKRGK